jgi:hypothetical protein
MRKVALFLALLTSGDALACGQSTHIWVALEAARTLPEGELKTFLEDPVVWDAYVNGAMFPDGGYSPLTQHPYGETAHWEPYQTHVAEALAEERPWATDDARREVAFLLGNMAHGYADQLYDGIYLIRSQVWDGAEAWGQWSVDEATDVALMAEVGPREVVDAWVPWDRVVAWMGEVGVEVDVNTLQTGQNSLRIAVSYVGGASQTPERLATYLAQFPWANGQLNDPSSPGSPASMVPAIGGYLGVFWARLQGGHTFEDAPWLYSWPSEGTDTHPTDASLPEIRVSMAMSHGIVFDSLAGRVSLATAGGREVPVDVSLYYGDGTNVLNLVPTEDLSPGTKYVVTLAPGIETRDGQTLASTHAWSFRTEGAGGCAVPQGATGLGVGLLVVALASRRRQA